MPNHDDTPDTAKAVTHQNSSVLHYIAPAGAGMRAIAASERFKDITGLTRDDSDQKRLHRAWKNDQRRAVYFLLATTGSPSEIATCLDLSRSATSQHLTKLEEAGLALGKSYGKTKNYTPSVGPLIEALGESHIAVAALVDFFESHTQGRVLKNTPAKTAVHATMHKVFDSLKGQRRLQITLTLMSGKGSGTGLDIKELADALGCEADRGLQHEITKLSKAGLISSSRTKMQSKAKHRININPLITIINDLNVQYGEGTVVDLNVPFKKRNFERSKDFDKSITLFHTLSVESAMNTLDYVHRRAPSVALRVTVERRGKKYTRQEERTVSKLRETGLIVATRNGQEIYLKANWQPLQQTLCSLLAYGDKP